MFPAKPMLHKHHAHPNSPMAVPFYHRFRQMFSPQKTVTKRRRGRRGGRPASPGPGPAAAPSFSQRHPPRYARKPSAPRRKPRPSGAPPVRFDRFDRKQPSILSFFGRREASSRESPSESRGFSQNSSFSFSPGRKRVSSYRGSLRLSPYSPSKKGPSPGRRPPTPKKKPLSPPKRARVVIERLSDDDQGAGVKQRMSPEKTHSRGPESISDRCKRRLDFGSPRRGSFVNREIADADYRIPRKSSQPNYHHSAASRHPGNSDAAEVIEILSSAEELSKTRMKRSVARRPGLRRLESPIDLVSPEVISLITPQQHSPASTTPGNMDALSAVTPQRNGVKQDLNVDKGGFPQINNVVTPHRRRDKLPGDESASRTRNLSASKFDIQHGGQGEKDKFSDISDCSDAQGLVDAPTIPEHTAKAETPSLPRSSSNVVTGPRDNCLNFRSKEGCGSNNFKAADLKTTGGDVIMKDASNFPDEVAPCAAHQSSTFLKSVAEKQPTSEGEESSKEDYDPGLSNVNDNLPMTQEEEEVNEGITRLSCAADVRKENDQDFQLKPPNQDELKRKVAEVEKVLPSAVPNAAKGSNENDGYPTVRSLHLSDEENDTDDDDLDKLFDSPAVTYALRRNTRRAVKAPDRFSPEAFSKAHRVSVFDDDGVKSRRRRAGTGSISVKQLVRDRRKRNEKTRELEELRRDVALSIVDDDYCPEDGTRLIAEVAKQESEEEALRLKRYEKYEQPSWLFTSRVSFPESSSFRPELLPSILMNVLGRPDRKNQQLSEGDFLGLITENVVQFCCPKSAPLQSVRLVKFLFEAIAFDKSNISQTGTEKLDGVFKALLYLLKHHAALVAGLPDLFWVLTHYGATAESLHHPKVAKTGGQELSIEPDFHNNAESAQDPLTRIVSRNLGRVLTVYAATIRTRARQNQGSFNRTELESLLLLTCRIMMSPLGSQFSRECGEIISCLLDLVDEKEWPSFRLEAAKKIVCLSTRLCVQIEVVSPTSLAVISRRSRQLSLECAYLIFYQWSSGPSHDPQPRSLDVLQASAAARSLGLESISYVLGDVVDLFAAVTTVDKKTDVVWLKCITQVLQLAVCDLDVLTRKRESDLSKLLAICRDFRKSFNRMTFSVEVNEARVALDTVMTTVTDLFALDKKAREEVLTAPRPMYKQLSLDSMMKPKN